MIGWALLLAWLIAMALVFRRVPAFSLAIVGGLVGLAAAVALSLVNVSSGPASLLLVPGGIIVGAFVGWVIAILKVGAPTWVRDASTGTIGPAIFLGSIGLVIGGFAPSLIRESRPDMNPDLLVAAAIAGGAGWSTGAAIGWMRTRDVPPPGTAQRWFLGVLAATIALFGAMIATTLARGLGGPSFDEISPRDPGFAKAAAVAALDTGLAVLTIVAVIYRSSIRRVSAWPKHRAAGAAALGD